MNCFGEVGERISPLKTGGQCFQKTLPVPLSNELRTCVTLACQVFKMH